MHADLYKLLLYKKGGFFKTYRDTKKVPDIFVILVIILLSEYKGSKIVIRLGKEKYRIA